MSSKREIAVEEILKRAMSLIKADVTVEQRKGIQETVTMVLKSGVLSMVDTVTRDLPVKGERLIEIGCGTCWHGPLLLALGATSYLGIDYYINPQEKKISLRTDDFSEDRPYQEAPLSLRTFLESFNNCGFLQADFMNAEIPLTSFDAAFMVSVTEHLMDPLNTLRKVRDILVAGGKLYFAHDNYYSWKGHHLRPRKVSDYDLHNAEMRKVADWNHIEHFLTREQMRGDLNLNFIRIHELASIVKQLFMIDMWRLAKSSDEILDRLTDRIKARFPEYYREELETEMVYCLCSRPLTADTVARQVLRAPEGHRVSIDIGWANHENGFCYVTRIPAIANFSGHVLFEDQTPLGPGDSLHDDIRQLGSGRYSLWGEYLYFSASDNSDPRNNERLYTLKPATKDDKNIEETGSNMLLKPFQKEEGFCWIAKLPQHEDSADNAENIGRSKLVLYEDGRPLGPANSLHSDIRAKGEGRFAHWTDKLYFSTPDNSDPNGNGRTYTVAFSPEDWLRGFPEKQKKIREVVDYSLQVVRDHLSRFPGEHVFLKGRTVMELGPGNDLGPALVMMGYGARVIIIDKYLVEWDDSFHPYFYKMFLASAREIFPEMDTSPIEEVIRNKRHAAPNLECHKYGLEEVAFLPDKCIDVSMSNAVMEHLYDPELSCRELFRLTKPGGIGFHQIDFEDHRNFDKPLEYLTLSDDEFHSLFQSINGECGNRLRYHEFQSLFEKAGFTILHFEKNKFADDNYLSDVLLRIQPRFREMDPEYLRVLGGRFFFLKASASPYSDYVVINDSFQPGQRL
jgi:SAM-dependent methyltransferase